MQRPLLSLLLLAAPVAVLSQPLDKGHRILLERGFQIQGFVVDNFGASPPVWSVFDNANFNTPDWSWNFYGPWNYYGASPTRPWTASYSDYNHTNFTSWELPFAANCISIQLDDEQDLNSASVRSNVAAWFAAARPNYTNTILHINQIPFAALDANYRDFLSNSQPDMLMIDSYRFGPPGEGTWNLYSDMQRHRKFALSGHDGSGAHPIPYALYTQTVNYGRVPSESELRFNHFAAWTMGYTVTRIFTYNLTADAGAGESILFANSTNQAAPTASYYEIKELNRQGKNLGPALVRLLSTEVRFFNGQHKDPSSGLPVANPNPIDIQNWSPGIGDPYLRSVAVTNSGTKNDGLPGDLLIGWFKVLDESFDDDWTNEIYFMVINGLVDTNGYASDCLQHLQLNFDLGNSGIDSVQRLSRDTGLKENILLPMVGGRRQLSIDLDGGTAELFKFKTGASFVGVPDTGPPEITRQPLGVTKLVGSDATFSARAAGAAPLSYQWQRDGLNIPGATTNNYTRTNVQPADSGSYKLIVTNSLGSVTSAAAALSVVYGLPSFYEPFDYTNLSAPVSSNTPANWTYVGSGANDLNLAAGNLSYPGLAASLGNSATNGGAGLAVRRLFGTNFTSDAVYFSALFRVNDAGFGQWNGASSQVAALTASDNTSFRLQIMVKSNSPSAYVIGVKKGGSGSADVFDTTGRPAGATILLAGKYDYTITPNAVSLWINPPFSSFGAASPPATGLISATTGTDTNSSGMTFLIDRFNFRQNAASGANSVPAAMQWDELRVGTNWAAVTPAKIPLTLRLDSLTLLPDRRAWLRGSGDLGQISIEASADLAAWNTLTNISNLNGTFEFVDPATNLFQRYYRAKLSP
jgi:hypothetical protein